MSFFKSNKIFFYTLGALVLFFLFYFFVFNAPTDFPSGTILKVEEGLSLRNVSLKLKEANIIRSRLVFEAFVIFFGREKYLIEADYYFENKLPVFEVARRISKGERHIAPVSVTIPEGFNLMQISDVFVSKLKNFNKYQFLTQAKSLEGYLFPDTYFFLTTDSEKEVIKYMNDNFNQKIASIRSDILSSHKTEREIIIMASIIEGEAKGDNDREIISGILWKRIGINMPLQVDVASDTYKTKGLPKNPIGNPGLEAILAAIHPKSSPYLYYLHDKDGVIHYAKTFAEHNRNVLKYLK